MPRYIDAEKLEKDGWSASRTYQQDAKTMVYETKKMTNFSTADVVEVKHGKWTLGKNMHGYPTVPYYREVLYCSECRSEAYWDSEDGQQEFDWCPYCGAKMDGKETEDGNN